MPHLHLLLASDIHIASPEELEEWISAELPEQPDPNDADYNIKKRYLDLVVKHHIHGPCEAPTGHDPWPCRADKSKIGAHGKCSKWYPKDFSAESIITTQGYAEPKRPDNGRHHVFGSAKNARIATNQHVVPHNPFLSMLVDAHCNVECIKAPHSAMIYLFKYINKGSDQAIVQFREQLVQAAVQEGREEIVIDECVEYQQMRFMTSCEAAYRLLGYPLWGMSHTIVELKIHEPDKETIMFEDEDEQQALERANSRKNSSQLTAYFKLCASNPQNDSLSYLQVPTRFTWNATTYCWTDRKQRTCDIISRIRWVHLQHKELFAIRVLLYNRTGVISFKDLRTVNGVTCDTFYEAAAASGLLEDETEWDQAMAEAVRFQLPASARRTFVIILLHATNCDYLALWEKYKAYMITANLRRPAAIMEQLALAHIESILSHYGKTLHDYNLPCVDHDEIDAQQQEEAAEAADGLWQRAAATMNFEQKALADKFLQLLDYPKVGNGRFIFCQASGGTGKSFTFNAVLNAAEARGKKVLAVASTGIAAQLLKNGRTAHTAFQLGLNPTATTVANIEGQSKKAALLRDLDGLIFDEAVMVSRTLLELIDRTLRSFALPENRTFPFGGVAVMLGGDWKQLLPVIIKGSEQAVIQSTHRFSYLWPLFQTYTLRTNMRADAGQREFSEWLEKVGSGHLQVSDSDHGSEEYIYIEPNMVMDNEKQVIDWVFDGDTLHNPFLLADVVLLTVQNKRTMELNEIIMSKFHGHEHVLMGSNTIVVKDNQNPDIPVLQPEHVAHRLPNGFPPTKLILKKGAVVMLLRNLDVTNGLCNGTRLLVKEICSNRLLRCGRISQVSDSDEDVLIPRIDFNYESEDGMESFKRRQFPVRPAFSMTINKSQGQTFRKVGIVLYEPVFSHGQLYVALSRVRNRDSLRIATPGFKAVARLGRLDEVFVRNVVYGEVIGRSDPTNNSGL